MENTLNETQSRNAAKIVGLTAAIALTGGLAVKAKQAVSRRRQERKLRKADLIVVEE